MKRYNIKAISSFITLWLFFTFSLAHSSDYIFTTIDFPGSAWTYALGINNDGLIVGAYGDDNGIHGYLLDGTNFTAINYPGSYHTDAFDINSFGDMVGVYFSNDGGHGFLYDGVFTSVDAIPWASNRAYGINDNRLIVGRYFSGGLDHGYVYDLTNYSVIEPATAIWSGAYGINNNGFIVGGYFDGIKRRGFLYKDSNFTDIDFPDSVDTIAFDINNDEIIVGRYAEPLALHGFIYDGSGFKTIDFPGASWTSPYGINDAKVIVGNYGDINGTHGFFATPLPVSIPVDIDIKPGNETNCLNINDHGVIPVAILGNIDFDVTQVDPATCFLEGMGVKTVGKKGKYLAHVKDINNDDYDDFLLKIEDKGGNLVEGQTEASLTGALYDGTPIEGSDSICIVPKNKKKSK